MNLTKKLKNNRVIRKLLGPLYIKFKNTLSKFNSSADYWEARYKKGGNSGAGSYSKFASFKANVINQFIVDHNVDSVIEFGCGDGNQLELAKYPTYLGLDVSSFAIEKCKKKFNQDPTKNFMHIDEINNHTADLCLSLDVIYHLIEDNVYKKHISDLFNTSNKFVIIYSSNTNSQEKHQAQHVKHRKFLDDIPYGEWDLIKTIPNKYPYDGNEFEGSIADFFIFKKS